MAQPTWPMDRGAQLQLDRHWRNVCERAEREEIEQRVRDHKLRVTRRGRAREFAGIKALPQLDLLAIGDSWFSYPLDGNLLVPPYSFGIVADQNLGSMGNPCPNILNLAKPGQASTAVLSYQNQQTIIDLLTDPSQWSNERGPDAILVSAGGDDIAGDQLAIYLDYGGTSKKASDRLEGVLDLVTASYIDLFTLRDTFANGVPIFGHCYDYALPDGVPAAFVLGPWLKPSFDFALYTTFADAQRVVADIIDRFHDRLNQLASNPKYNFHLVETRKMIASNNTFPNGWANELHPFTLGFYKLAQEFLVALQAQFPGRI
jgi:hypothetical protein